MKVVMGTKKGDEVLKNELQSAAEKVIIGGKYQHYKSKNKLYRVVGFATLEATDELCVIYRALYGEKFTFVRQIDIWLENVEWQGKILPRFKYISVEKKSVASRSKA